MYKEDTNCIFFTKTGMDRSKIQSIVDTSLRGADDGEIYFEYSQSEFFSWDDGRLKNSSYDTDMGFGMRSVAGDTFSYAHSSDMTEAAIKRAGDTVKSVLKGYTGKIGHPPAQVNNSLYMENSPIKEVDFKDKIKLLQDIDIYARSKDSRVKQVSISLAASWQAIQIMRSGGYVVTDIRPLVRLSISVYAEHNGKMESGYSGLGGRYSYNNLVAEKTWKAAVDEAFRQAEVNLNSVPAPAGEMDVVLGSGWPGILLHEAVGHGLEGDFNRKGTSVFSNLMGERVAAKGVTVVDDGTIVDRRGSITVDDEGTPSQRNVLIEDGILKCYMQDRMNGRLMGGVSTGNGRRESYSDSPLPRMTNTFMLNGAYSREEIIASVKKGIYAANFGGGQVDITSGNFVFEASEAYMIENGKIGAPIKGATLIGSGADALKRISMIGNDMALDDGIGTCGKDGQSIPVGVGQPSLRLDKLTVGGTAE